MGQLHAFALTLRLKRRQQTKRHGDATSRLLCAAADTHRHKECAHTHAHRKQRRLDRTTRALKPIAISEQLKELPTLSVLSANKKADQLYLLCVCVCLCVCVRV